MEALRKYIYDTLGISIQLERLQSHEMSRFPFFIKQNFHFFIAQLFDRDFILAHLINEQELTGLTQITRQLKILNEGFERPTVLILDDVPAITRKRLVGKGINFIVPGKQMYLPAVLVDFNEVFKKPFPKNEQLMPSAQVILFYQFLKRDINIEELQFKQLAEDLNYSAMTITKAAENLKYHDLCQTSVQRRNSSILYLLLKPFGKRHYLCSLIRLSIGFLLINTQMISPYLNQIYQLYQNIVT